MAKTPVPEMVDRVARALESQLDVAEMVMADPMTLRRLKAKRLARVAIEAMREPSAADVRTMAHAMSKALYGPAADSMAWVDSTPVEREGELQLKVDGHLNLYALARAAFGALSSPAPTEEG